MKRIAAVLLVSLLSSPVFANFCPSIAPSKDGCSTKIYDKKSNTYQTAFIFSESAFVYLTFPSACNKHDTCYGTLGLSKATCDSRFRSDAHDICDDKFNKYLKPAENALCRNQADLAYGVLRNIDAAYESFDEAQQGSAERSVSLNNRIQSEQCFTVPSRAGVYHSSLESYINESFQSLKGRLPSKFETFSLLALYDPNTSLSAWKNTVLSAIANITTVPPIAKASKDVDDFTYKQVAYASQGNNLSYRWNINGATVLGPVYSINYEQYPRFTQTYTFKGYLYVKDAAGNRDFDLVDDTFIVRGLCGDGSDRICNQIP